MRSKRREMHVCVLLPFGDTLEMVLKGNQQHMADYVINFVFNKMKIEDENRDYFALQFADREDGGFNWLVPEDNLKNIRTLERGALTRLEFAVRMFPREPHLAFASHNTRRLFRQCVKRALLACKLGCSTVTHALLDGYLLQAETGDFHNLNYYERTQKLEIQTPTSLNCSTIVQGKDYLRMVRNYHEKMIGKVTSADADVQYLKVVAKIPFYGYITYTATYLSETFYVALSNQGVHFIYETTLSLHVRPNEKLYTWHTLTSFDFTKKSKFKLEFLNEKTNTTELKKFKIDSVRHNDEKRFKSDFKKLVGMLCASLDNALKK